METRISERNERTYFRINWPVVGRNRASAVCLFYFDSLPRATPIKHTEGERGGVKGPGCTRAVRKQRDARFDPHLRRRRKYLPGSGGLSTATARDEGVGERGWFVRAAAAARDRENIVSKSIPARQRRCDADDCFAAYAGKLSTEATGRRKIWAGSSRYIIKSSRASSHFSRNHAAPRASSSSPLTISVPLGFATGDVRTASPWDEGAFRARREYLLFPSLRSYCSTELQQLC